MRPSSAGAWTGWATLAASGRTVLFVSHNMDLIPRLCRKAIALDRGRIVREGPARSVVERYLAEMARAEQAGDLSQKSRSGDGRARFASVRIVGPDGAPSPGHPSGEDLVVRVTVKARGEVRNAALAVNLKTLHGARLISGWTREAGFDVDLHRGEQVFECRFEGVRVRPSHRVSIELWMEAGTVMDHVTDALVFEALDGVGTDRFSTDAQQGVLLCDYRWSRVN